MKGEYVLLAAVVIGGAVVWSMRKQAAPPQQTARDDAPLAPAPNYTAPSGYRTGPAGAEDVAIAALNFGGKALDAFSPLWGSAG